MKNFLARLHTIVNKHTVFLILGHLKDYKLVYMIVAGTASVTGLTYESEAVSKSIVEYATIASQMLTSVLG